MNIERYQKLCADDTIVVTQHANRRFQERKIFLDDIESAILNGEIIEEYSNDTPFPSCLILGNSAENLPLHIVVSADEEFLYIITAYYPNLQKWNEDFKTRRSD